MAPKSILKKRPAAAVEAEEEIQEVPRAGPAKEREFNNESEEDDEDEDDDDDMESDSELEGDSYDETDEDADAEEDEDAIRDMNGKAKPIKKLKHTTLRPAPAPAFSLALNHLLNLPPSTSTLHPKNAPPSAQTQRLERRAKNLIRETKANHLARGHVRDVIAGWGARPALPFSQWESASAREFERAQSGGESVERVEVETGAEREKRLRKLAQRGVVRLFNAIGAAQGAPAKAEREEKKRKLDEGRSEGGSMATTTIGELEGPGGKVLRRPNVLGGRGKGEALSNLSKASFLDLIRAGTTSSTTPLQLTSR